MTHASMISLMDEASTMLRTTKRLMAFDLGTALDVDAHRTNPTCPRECGGWLRPLFLLLVGIFACFSLDRFCSGSERNFLSCRKVYGWQWRRYLPCSGRLFESGRRDCVNLGRIGSCRWKCSHGRRAWLISDWGWNFDRKWGKLIFVQREH